MNNNGLNPCPSCGGKAKVSKFGSKSAYGVWYNANCSKCGVAQTGVSRKTRQEAVEAWNRRADEKEDT